MANDQNSNLQYYGNGLKLTEGFEGKRNLAYDDARPNYVLKAGDTLVGILTIAYGHTGKDVFIGQTVTDAEAETLLAHDVETAENFVKRVVNAALTRNEFDACVDFTFNCGVGSFLKSSMLRFINQGLFQQAADAFLLWDKVAGKVNNGIHRRRVAERSLFESGILEATA